jgi:hypothetical protein
LLTVADVARLLPRHWDGQRLLRFLTGLALLALAFAAHAGVTTPPPAAVARPDPVPAIVAAPAPVESAVVPVEIAVVPVETAAVDASPMGAQSNGAVVALAAGLLVVLAVRAGGRLAVPGGVVPGAYGARGPPLAG